MTFLFADMVGSTHLLEVLRDGYADLLSDYRRLITTAARAHGGELVDTQGDAVFLAFPTASGALAAAIEGQRALVRHEWPAGAAVLARMGLHTGEPLDVDGGYVGMDVHRAARVSAAGSGAQILLSQTTHDLVADDLPDGATLRDLGEHRLKDLKRMMRLYQVLASGLPAASPRLTSLEVRPIAIAVLPLTDLSGDAKQEYFPDGMTEALIADLAKIGALRVISRTSVMTYKGSDKLLPEIARALGVNAIVQGSVLRTGGRVRISVQLIDATSDTHLWSETYERKLTNVLKLQGELAQAIVRQVKIRLTPQERARLSESPVVDPSAHDAFLRGRYYLNRATPTDVTQAIAYFEEAIRRDATYALAYAGLANAYNYIGWLGGAPAREAFPKAKQAAFKALELDETLADAHDALGYSATFYDWDWPTAERELERALALNPNSAEGYLHLSWYLGSQGRLEEGRAAITKAGELDPLSLVIHANRANYHQWKREFDAALEQTRRTLELAPDLALALLFSGMAHWGKGHYEDAARVFARLVALAGPGFKGYLAYSLAKAGQTASVTPLLDELLAAPRVLSFQVFLVHLGLGRVDDALTWLERAYDEREGAWFPYLRQEVVFDPLRDHPRFRELLRRLNFSH